MNKWKEQSYQGLYYLPICLQLYGKTIHKIFLRVQIFMSQLRLGMSACQSVVDSQELLEIGS